MIAADTRALDSVLGFNRTMVAAAVQGLLEDTLFTLQARHLVEAVLETFRQSGGQFPDHLIGLTAREAGAATTYTFDRKASKLPGFTFLR